MNAEPKGYFGKHGGRYVPEMFAPALDELERGYNQFKNDATFRAELESLLKNYVGRPTPLYFAENLTRKLGGAKIYLKLESLNHTGAHKINNAIGQALLAQKIGKRALVAETGAGQHGLAAATVAAKMGFGCKVFMGEVDVKRQYPNVYAMRLLGAAVVPVADGTRTLKDAVSAALKHWVENLETTHYLLGSALGPHPYPEIVRDFQSVIGREVMRQMDALEKRQPDILVACVGGGSNALGLFYPYLERTATRLVGVEAGGKGAQVGEHAARLSGETKEGILHGYKSYFVQTADGQIGDTHSVSAGLDYAGVGPELAHLYDAGRVEFQRASDDEALEGFELLARCEGIIPALETAHALAYIARVAPKLPSDNIAVVNLSGRGDKDIFITAKRLDNADWMEFLRNEIA